MKRGIVIYNVEYCNSDCPHFYHSFEHGEDMYCSKLGKKIWDYDGEDVCFDSRKRPIPKNCPLEDL